MSRKEQVSLENLINDLKSQTKNHMERSLENDPNNEGRENEYYKIDASTVTNVTAKLEALLAVVGRG